MYLAHTNVGNDDEPRKGSVIHIQKLVQSYFTWKCIGKKTEDVYRSVLKIFLDKHKDFISEITYEIVCVYRDKLVANGQRTEYVRHQINVIRSFFRYLHTFDHYPNNIYEAVHTTGLSKYQGSGGPIFTDDQIKSIFNEAYGKEGARTIINYRNYAIFRLLQGSGLRIGELADLKVKDLKTTLVTDENNKIVEIYVLSFVQKGGIDSIARVFPKTKSAIYLYLKKRGIVNGEDYLFPAHFNNRKSGGHTHLLGHTRQIKRITLLDLVRKTFDKAGLSKEYTSHNFRHTIGDKVFRAQGNEQMAGQQLRHTSPKTIQFYTKKWRNEIAANNCYNVEV